MAGYRFEGKLDNNAPRQDEYTFYIAAMDNSGNYSEVNEVTVQHPGIAQLPQPEVQRFFEAFVIEMPEVLTKFSKNQVYPDNSLIEEKDILGYVIRLDRVDTAQEGEKSFIEKKVPAGKSSEMIEVPAKSEWEITIGAYDSVYHPDYNATLFESTFSEPLAISARQIDDIVDFVDELRPVEIVDTLPTLPDPSHPEGSIVFLWGDKQLYKQENGTWKKIVNTDDLAGQITETQITDNSISTPKLQANAITANEILAGTITANEIASNTITAGQIEAGAISADEIAADAITSDKISSGEIYGYHVQADEIDTIHLKANSVEADKINVNDLSAINANFSGTLQAVDGTFTGSLVGVDGTFSGDLSAVDGKVKISETINGGYINFLYKTSRQNIFIGNSSDKTGFTTSHVVPLIELAGDDTDNLPIVRLTGEYNSTDDMTSGVIKLYDEYGGNLDTRVALEASRNGASSLRLRNETGRSGVIMQASGSYNAGDTYIKFSYLPTSDPTETGVLWDDNGILRVSQG